MQQMREHQPRRSRSDYSDLHAHFAEARIYTLAMDSSIARERRLASGVESREKKPRRNPCGGSQSHLYGEEALKIDIQLRQVRTGR
jgi:hypothetical protein